MFRPGNQPSCIAWRVSVKVPVMIAWLAMMVAKVASTTSGTTSTCGTVAKNGLPLRSGCALSAAAWPR